MIFKIFYIVHFSLLSFILIYLDIFNFTNLYKEQLLVIGDFSFFLIFSVSMIYAFYSFFPLTVGLISFIFLVSNTS